MPSCPTPTDLFEILLAGGTRDEIQPDLDRLPTDERQTVLCSVCYVVDEVAANCKELASTISDTLSGNCLYYQNGLRRCGLVPVILNENPRHESDGPSNP
jgi:hypothetical protein